MQLSKKGNKTPDRRVEKKPEEWHKLHYVKILSAEFFVFNWLFSFRNTSLIKELRFRPHTDDHDFEFKMRHAREFLSEGNKVKAMVQFRGRDIVYNEQGLELLKRFADALSDVGKMESPPKLEGKRMNMLLAPTK